jgi:hypothetical protein
MREIKNNVLRDLSFQEHKAIIEAAELLQKAFGRKIYGCFLNADQKNPEECFAVNFTFDLVNVNKV